MESDAAEPDARRWSTLVDAFLPPRAAWPDRVYSLPSLRYAGLVNLAEEFLDNPQIDPDKTAVRFRGGRLSYRELRRRVLAMAVRLQAAGVGPTDRVVLRMANRPAWLVAWLAVQWLGAVGVHLSPLYRRREIVHVVGHSTASTIVCDHDSLEEIARACQECPAPVRAISVDETAESGDPPPARLRHPDRPAIICYITSADGPPKGVVLSSADLLASADTYARQVLELSRDDVCVGTVGIAWAYGLGGLVTFPLRVGATTTFVDGAMNLLQAIGDTRPTVLFSVPTMYRLLLRHPALASSDLRSLRVCVSSAEPLPVSLAVAWQKSTGLEIVDGFGTTEIGHICISSRPGSARPGFLGTPVPGYEARIVNDGMRDVPEGTEGLLAVRGPTGACYWRGVEHQRRVVRDGWTLTGDIGVRHHDDWFQHLRRADALIVSAGYKISSREVEQVLAEHPDVASARVFQVPDAVRGAVLKAVVARSREVDPGELAERLQTHIKSVLASFKCPREIQVT
jgi:2-aminobenzoate-CoA ligase